MNRRNALKTMAAGLAAFILPAPRPRIDLGKWTASVASGNYDLRTPYTLDEFTYATDAFACVRVRPESGDVVQRHGKIPPLTGLPWNHDALRGWRRLPRLEALEADDSYCPRCSGYGWLNASGRPVCGTDCERCDGMGKEWVGADYHLSHPVKCRACGGRGYIQPPNSGVCPTCCGLAIGRFASIVRLDGRYFNANLYEKAWSLGGEYVHDDWLDKHDHPMIKFRFPDGLGLLMGLEGALVERRLTNG